MLLGRLLLILVFDGVVVGVRFSDLLARLPPSDFKDKSSSFSPSKAASSSS